MKRLIPAIVLGVTLAMLLALAPSHGAGTTTTETTTTTHPTLAQVEARMTPAELHNFQVGTLAARHNPALRPVIDHHPGTGNGGIQKDVSVSLGWAVYIHFTHDDAASTVFIAALAGVAQGLGWVCGAVAFVNAGAGVLCALDVVLDSAGTLFLLAVASSKSETLPASWCGSFLPAHGFNWTACNYVGGIGEYGNPFLAYNPFWPGGYYEWVYNTRDFGATIDLAYVVGTLIGWSVDEGACPC